MKKVHNKFRSAVLLLAVAVIQSCVNLEERVYDTITEDNFYKNEEQYAAIITSVYAQVRSFTPFAYDSESLTTDEMLAPTRGSNWDEGGAWRQYHDHAWTYEHVYLGQLWTLGYNIVNKANEIIHQLTQPKGQKYKNEFLPELFIARSYGYYYLINAYGNVPVVDRYDVPAGYLPKNGTHFNEGRKVAYDFAVKDITTNIAALSEEKGGQQYGRFNKWAAYALLAKYYLNSEVWTGTARWDECIAACDEIINKGGYILEPDYFTNFLSNNEGSRENIFVIPFDNIRTGWGLIFYWYYLHYSEQAYYKTANQPWNGPCAIPSFIKSFTTNDKRKKGWLIGVRITPAGDTLRCTEDSKGKPLNYTVDFESIYEKDGIKYNHANAREYFGARFAKYQIEPGLSGWTMGNDLAVFRYAEILLTKAEALMRKNGGATQEAVDLVNKVRARAFDKDPAPWTVATLTLDAILKERGWELYNENMRRNDLIRFKKFVRGTWEFADRSGESDTRNVFPIPQAAVGANTNLTQNPGY